MLRKILLRLRTLRFLKPAQVYYFLLRRYLPTRRIKVSNCPSVRFAKYSCAPCSISGIRVTQSTFRFLNEEVNLALDDGGLDWSPASQSRLWQYHLHYFDYLRESARPFEEKDQLVHYWIEQNPQGSRPGWEPFTASLRIVNWIFYLSRRSQQEIPALWLESLYLQALWLERNLEKHILANHYFENLKALYFAGCFFNGSDAERWLRIALREIPRQVHEQTLSDGGHYERSPLYHCLMMENLLDVCNLGQSYPDLSSADFQNLMRSHASAGLEWLAEVVFPDETFPLFNDSAFGSSIEPRALFDYAERLSIDFNLRDSEGLEMINRPDSGLYGCRTDSDMFIIDCGDIGPAYQPGHTHCDFLSYELMLFGRRIVIDTGVCEYRSGFLRDYVRSTKAHNTISVDETEQSEIWGEFRVARRARKLGARVSRSGNAVEFFGAYKGFHCIKGDIEHQRVVVVSLSNDEKQIRSVEISDSLYGTGQHLVENYVHFRPGIELTRLSHEIVEIIDGSINIAQILVADGQEYHVESAVYCPEFGKQLTSPVLVLRTRCELPVTLHYAIHVQE